MTLKKVSNELAPHSHDSKGLQRAGFKVERSKGEMVTNAEQFTKYSRLQAMCK